MKTFELELFDSHPVIRDNGEIILIDTGSPGSVNSLGNLDFMGRSHQAHRSYQGVTSHSLSELVGTPITTLMGTDLLIKYKVLFDYGHNQVTFSEDEITFEGHETNLQTFMGIPIVKLVLEGEKFKFFLDTGARLSYLSGNVTSKYQSVGIEEDFYPGAGRFRVACFELETIIGNDRFQVKYGEAPALVETMLKMANVEGIIGYDFFIQFRILLDLYHKNLIYSRNI